MMDRVFILLGLSLCLTAPSAAQTVDQADQQETIKALLQEVKELKSRVAALEAKQMGEQAAAPVPPAPAQIQSPEAGPFGIVHGIKFQGFASVTYKASTANPPELGASNGFRPGSAGSFSIGVGDLGPFPTSPPTTQSQVLGGISLPRPNQR